MGTTTVHGAVSTALTHSLLDQRKSLPRGLNGRGPAPSDPRAASILKEIAHGQRTVLPALLCVLECNEADGVPMPEITRVLRELIAHLEARRAARGHGMIERPLLTLFRMETKAQARLDLAQLRLAESPTSVQALEEALHEADRYEAIFAPTKQAIVRDLATVRLYQPAQQVVTRSMSVSR